MSSRRRDRKGQWVDRRVSPGRYYCRQIHEEHISPDCPRTIGSTKADNDVWEKVCKAINKPEILLAQAHKMVAELQNNAGALNDDQDRIQNELDTLTLERQWVITQARKGAISNSDMDYQLGAMTLQELSLKRDLTSIGQAVNIHLLNDWEAKVNEYLVDLQIGLESLNAAPQNNEERQEIFALKKQIVNTLVRRVTIDRYRELHVEISLNLLNLINNDTPKGFEGKNKDQIKPAGIYPRRRDHPRTARACVSLRRLAYARAACFHGLFGGGPFPHPPRQPGAHPSGMQINPGTGDPLLSTDSS